MDAQASKSACSVYENLTRDMKRGHTVRAVSDRESFRLAKDAGFKVVAHMMPNVGVERDLEQFTE